MDKMGGSRIGDGWRRALAESVAILSLFALPAIAAAQTYIFVSPNTSGQMPLAKAESALNSAEEQKMLDAAHEVLCRVGARGDAQRALGVWVDGTENSVLVQVDGASGSAAEYAAAKLGVIGQQRAVLVFEPQAGGRDRLYRLQFAQRPDRDVIRTVEKNRMIDLTLVPGSKMLLLISGSADDHKRAELVAQALTAKLTSLEGVAHLMGDSFDRDKGVQKLAAIATEYENRHPETKSRACK